MKTFLVKFFAVFFTVACLAGLAATTAAPTYAQYSENHRQTQIRNSEEVPPAVAVFSIIMMCFGLTITAIVFGFNIWMIFDVAGRDLEQKNLWLVILIAGLFGGFGPVAALIYFFTERKKHIEEKS